MSSRYDHCLLGLTTVLAEGFGPSLKTLDLLTLNLLCLIFNVVEICIRIKFDSF